MWTPARTQEDWPWLLTDSIKPGLGMVQCHHTALSSLLPRSYSEWTTERRQPRVSEIGAESTPHSILLVCLVEKRKTEITQKEMGLKLTLINAERCWGRNSMWYQVKNTCFSQVQTRTTCRLLDCSKDRDQCSVRLWAAFLSSVDSRSTWLAQDCLQFTLGDFRSCQRPIY